MRGTARAYFLAGLDRSTKVFHNDVWTIDLSPLFLPGDGDDNVKESITEGDDVGVGSTSKPNGNSDQAGVDGTPAASGAAARASTVSILSFLFLPLALFASAY